jgi:hypothetical protein
LLKPERTSAEQGRKIATAEHGNANLSVIVKKTDLSRCKLIIQLDLSVFVIALDSKEEFLYPNGVAPQEPYLAFPTQVNLEVGHVSRQKSWKSQCESAEKQIQSKSLDEKPLL